MKKILILSMFCNSEFFVGEEHLVMDTWAKPVIDGEFPNIQFFGYTASYDGKYHIDYSKHIIQVPCDDSLWGTAEKTIKCFKLIQRIGIDYDYVFRTNTSTYVNVSLLNELIQTYYAPDVVWSSSLFSPDDKGGPYQYCVFACGRALVLSKDLINVLIDNDNAHYAYNHDYATEVNNKATNGFSNAIYKVDDNYMGFMLNSWFIRKKENHLKHYRTFAGVQLPCGGWIETDYISSNMIMTFRVWTGDEREKDARYAEYEMFTIVDDAIRKNSHDLALIYEYINDDMISIYNYGGYRRREEILQILKEHTDIPYLDK